MRFLFSFWILALCLTSCTKKKAGSEDQMPTQAVMDSATQSATKTPEALATPEVASTPEATPAPEDASASKNASISEAVAGVKRSPKKVVSSTVSDEPSASVNIPSFRPRSTRAGGYLCDSVEFIKYERLHDGEGGFIRGKVLVYNSKQCGYIAPVVSKESPKASPVTTPVASQEPMPTPEQWVADPLSPEKCEDGILYKFEKSAQTGAGRKVKIGVCAVEAAKPDYLNKSIQQVKDDGLIKKGESGTRKKDN